MTLIKSLHCSNSNTRAYKGLIIQGTRNLQVLFDLHSSERPCKEEHMHLERHVYIVPNSNSRSCSNSSLLECWPVSRTCFSRGALVEDEDFTLVKSIHSECLHKPPLKMGSTKMTCPMFVFNSLCSALAYLFWSHHLHTNLLQGSVSKPIAKRTISKKILPYITLTTASELKPKCSFSHSLQKFCGQSV
jgi:hypothetical protein